MSEQREYTVSEKQQDTIIDVEKAILQLDTEDLQPNSWQHHLKQRENTYDDYLNKYELKVKDLETEIVDLQRSVSLLLGDFEGVSNTERANSMKVKKSQLLECRQAMEQEINVPIDEFAVMDVASEVTEEEGWNLTFYHNLGIKVRPNTKDNEHTMNLVSYHIPDAHRITLNENSDHFITAQKIWHCISPK